MEWEPSWDLVLIIPPFWARLDIQTTSLGMTPCPLTWPKQVWNTSNLLTKDGFSSQSWPTWSSTIIAITPLHVEGLKGSHRGCTPETSTTPKTGHFHPALLAMAGPLQADLGGCAFETNALINALATMFTSWFWRFPALTMYQETPYWWFSHMPGIKMFTQVRHLL